MRTRSIMVLLGVASAIVVAGCGSATPESTPTAASSTVTSPPQAAGAAYVHLGDSYAAGAGITPLVEGSDLQCLRSQRNFGEIIAAQRKSQYPSYRDVSCAGAATAALTQQQYPGIAPQLDALGPGTRLVTLMLGGNDGDIFGSAIAKCSQLATQPGAPCADRYGSEFTDYLTTTTQPALQAGLTAIRKRAPSARVVIVGYPWLLPPSGGCYPTMRIAAGDVPYLRRVQVTLNTVVRRAAARAGVDYVSMAAASSGHDACAGSQRWIEPMQGATTTITLHPNAAGQRALAAATLAVLGR